MRYIVCVDDDKAILDSLQQELIDLIDYEVFAEFCLSGSEAIELVDQLTEEGHILMLLITDQMMPEMTGIELIEKLSERGLQNENVLLTGYTEFESDQFNNEKVLRVLEKPWDKEDLFDLILNSCDV
jgi:YesN/AraC family two-component response regulator